MAVGVIAPEFGGDEELVPGLDEAEVEGVGNGLAERLL